MKWFSTNILIRVHYSKYYKKSSIADFRAVSISENGIRPFGNDLRRLRSYDSRQIRDASSWKKLPRGMSVMRRVCNTFNSFLFHPRIKTLLSDRLWADLWSQVCTMHGEDQLLGFRVKDTGFGISRGVFCVLHVRPTFASWRPLFPTSGTTDLPKRLWARVVPEQSSSVNI